jgi:pyrroline-5-carboxylate reductase
MPNMPCLVGEAMSAFAAASGVSARDRQTARRLLACFGEALELPEKQLDAVTALSGSGPAFFAYVLNAMAEAAAKEGLRRKDALFLAEQTMLGTARLLMEKKLDPEDLVRSVASARGTTAAGLDVMDRAGLAETLRRAIRSAARRSRELSR